LHIACQDLGRAAIVAAAGGLAPDQVGSEDRRVRNRGEDVLDAGGRRRRWEKAFAAEILGLLMPIFRTEQERMMDAASVEGGVDVGLIEEVPPLRCVDVSRHLDDHARRVDTGRQASGVGLDCSVHRSRKDILIEFVIVGVTRPVADRYSIAESVFDEQRACISIGACRAVTRIAEKLATRRLQRLTEIGGNAAVGDAIILEMLVAQRDGGIRSEPERCGRIKAPPLVFDPLAVTAAVLVDAGQAERKHIVDRRAEIDLAPIEIVAAGLQTGAEMLAPVCDFGDAVDDAAHAAAAENHGIGAFEDLEPFDIVEIAVGLDVVADAIDEEIAGRRITAEHQRLTIALALRRENTGDIADGIANAGRGLVRDLLHCHHVDRLRHVDQRRVGAHRRNAPGRLVGGFRLTVVDCSIGHGYAAEHGGLLLLCICRQSQHLDKRGGGQNGST